MEFKYVSDHQQHMILASLEYLPGWELVSAEYLGSYSATEVIYRAGEQTVRIRLPYDFAFTLPEDARGRAVADEAIAQGLADGIHINRPKQVMSELQSVVYQDKVGTADNFDAFPDVERKPDTEKESEPKKTTKGNRPNKAVSDSKDGDE